MSKTNTSDRNKSRINYLISKAYIVKGDYSSALNFLYKEKNYLHYLTEEQNALAYVSPFPSPFPVDNGPVSIIGGIDGEFVSDIATTFSLIGILQKFVLLQE